ncbi:MAG: CRTAC1 family protein [Myxococcales bacterium]|nr:CRTAC1 family protein [Myxococcales bacterium]
MRSLLRFLGASGCLAFGCATATSCSDDETGSGGDAGSTTSSGATTTGSGAAGGGGAAPACGTSKGELPPGLVTIAWDDAVAETNVRNESFTITVDGEDYALNEVPLHEAVRFDLEHPARVHGFSIHWGGLPDPADSKAELTAGLYGDFGHNGFDFWEPEPLWSGSRCVEHADEDGFTTYVFDEPIVVEHPGLVYVAHRADPGTPVFDFDGTVTGDGSCAGWDDCHSAMNMPEAGGSTYYNGVSFPFQYDYLVRLHVEYTAALQPEERLFQPRDFAATPHVSFGDYDADGWDDMVTDGPKLWRNQGDGTFADATAPSGIAALGVAATGGVFGDYDNDGCVDLFLYAESYTAADVLLRSRCDGTFEDATAAAQIVDDQSYEACNAPGVNVRSPTAAAAWVDVDADGALDLYLANFICWENGNTYVDQVWHNRGDGTFEEWTSTNGFTGQKLAGRGVAPADSDGDGDVDIFVNDYRLHRNLYFDNLGDGTVLEDALAKGVAGHNDLGYYGHTIGAAWGDLDNDLDLDLVSANLAHPRFFDFSDKTEVLLQDASHSFADTQGDWMIPAGAAGLRYQETHSVPVLADFDQDGVLDLVITAVYPGRPTDFYWGNGDGTFTLDAYHAGITTEDGWGAAVADIDHDGDLDLFAHRPFVNEIPVAGHWLQVKAVGNVSANRMAIGATVFVTADGQTRMRHVQGGTGKGGQDSLYLHFGLGDATTVSEIRVVYPGGAEVTFAGPFDADQRVWVYEDGTTALGWSNPG